MTVKAALHAGQGMGNSIILDPMDLWRLQLGKKENFDTLLANYLELNVVDGMVLPNLKMAGEEEPVCS